MQSGNIIIRPFEANDWDSVRKICCDTAFMGESVENFFDDREVFADFAISYYTDYEPQSLFVAESEKSVIGYIAGCRDTKRCRKILESRILPKTILKSLVRGAVFKAKTINFILNSFKSLAKGEFKRPEFFSEYPAHLHINLLPEARRLGTGSLLMNRLLEYLRDNNIFAVHLSSFSKIGQDFFSKSGFKVLYSKRITYFDSLVKEPVYLIYYGRKI